LLLCRLSGIEKKLEAQRGALAIEEVNQSIGEMQDRFLVRRGAAKAEAATRNFWSNLSSAPSSSSAPGAAFSPSNAPTTPETANPNPQHGYASVRT